MEEAKKKICACCGRELPVTEFNKSSSAKDGLQAYCRKCAHDAAMESQRKKRAAKGVPMADHGLVQTAPPVSRTTIVPSSAKKVYHLEALASISNRDLIEELRQRGFSGKLEFTYKIDV